MKRLIAVVATLAIALSFCGCDGSEAVAKEGGARYAHDVVYADAYSRDVMLTDQETGQRWLVCYVLSGDSCALKVIPATSYGDSVTMMSDDAEEER